MLILLGVRAVTSHKRSIDFIADDAAATSLEEREQVGEILKALRAENEMIDVVDMNFLRGASELLSGALKSGPAVCADIGKLQ